MNKTEFPSADKQNTFFISTSFKRSNHEMENENPVSNAYPGIRFTIFVVVVNTYAKRNFIFSVSVTIHLYCSYYLISVTLLLF